MKKLLMSIAFIPRSYWHRVSVPSGHLYLPEIIS